MDSEDLKRRFKKFAINVALYFLELIQYFNPSFNDRINVLTIEGNELLAITVSSIKTMREKTNHKS